MGKIVTLKDQLQYRKFSAKAEGEKDKNCRHCKSAEDKRSLTSILFCSVVKDVVKGFYLCDRFERE
jgi:ribosomal protein L37AE/L43A